MEIRRTLAGAALLSMALVRDLTDQIVLDTVFEQAPVTRAETAQRTGISKTTVSESVRRLEGTRPLPPGRQRGRQGGVGTARDAESFGYVCIGAGLGMGLVIGDRLVRGARGVAGEIGCLGAGCEPPGSHLRHGFARAVAAAGFSARRRTVADALTGTERLTNAERVTGAEGRTNAGRLTSAGRVTGAEGRTSAGRLTSAGRVTGAEGRTNAGHATERDEPDSVAVARGLLRLADEGEGPARAVVERAGRTIGEAIATVCPVVDPELVLLGGPIGSHPALGALAPLPPPVASGALGDAASQRGARALALRRARADLCTRAQGG
ncbi:ROK family protein [Streptomyces sp. TP-A0356]|uniref:ROK family transcriptional regulator n=1 Tax=Streptomyces sp. TP-A0356 TaxID=1359208 RepID=UPI0006E1D209|nr:winged helix-turn-helix transcriptional regulator [Streptomyces sp. TP-A0356]